MAGVMLRNCSYDQPHIFHDYTEKVTLPCLGVTECGEQTHEPHTFTRDQSLWCRGICKCGDPARGDHGPGEHK